ncbi:MAG: trans-aconitate 2-methyltransferase [bacterium]
MAIATQISLPPDFNWQLWVDRWDRMQDRYLVHRKERFEVMANLIQATQSKPCRILDLGCGPGSTMVHLLESLPESQVIGIELDPTILALAEPRLKKFGNRAKLIQTDLRQPDWYKDIPIPINAIVSATALHWLNAEELANLYTQLYQLLSSGGIFLNADHIPSSIPAVQQYWEQHREQMRAEEGHGTADDWDGFWKAYSAALGIDLAAIQKSILGEWHGMESPLSWHLDTLRDTGFINLDCYWRCDCDAIYGGMKK